MEKTELENNDQEDYFAAFERLKAFAEFCKTSSCQNCFFGLNTVTLEEECWVNRI
jgi:hypothetical protein